MSDELLAKSGHNAPSLEQHTKDVLDAAAALFGTAAQPTRLGECWLRFFKLTGDRKPVFYSSLTAACGLHDWGKANDGFQNAVRRRGDQAIRHEHFSALLIAQPAVWAWLDRPDLDREVILSAVLTHHLKAGFRENVLHGFAASLGGDRPFRSLHRTEAFRQVALACGLGDPPDLSAVPERWTFDRPMPAERKRVQQLLNLFQKRIAPREGNDEPRRQLLHAVRAGLIVADAAGSGLRRTGQDIAGWVSGTFADDAVWDAGSVREKVIDPRVAAVDAKLKREGKAFNWTDFQDHCADTERVPDRALLLAPCGSGKTLAAWRWIEKQAEKRVGHVLFLYPTRATATEGFKDYVSWAPEAEVKLMHGTSGFDLAGMFDNPPDPNDPRRGRTFTEAEQRLFAVGLWGRRAFSATVDQFLAFLQYGYGPVCMLPVLADAVMVIDEVHSFDNSMFTALKGFLRNFDVPVLCMTATLPKNRRDELVNDCGLKPYEDRPGELATIAGAKRYRLRRADSQMTAEEKVREALAAKKRVLWVVNQVKRAHAVVESFATGSPTGDALATPDGVPVVCYHSRFKLTDRVDRHKETMRRLKDEPGPALGVTTQVCEMSLDIDVDLLVTEDCPVTALVQRMGRCNRAQTPRPPGAAGDVLVYQPAENAPYNRDSLTGLERFLELTDGNDLSQDDLEKAMAAVDPPPSPGDSVCSFLESGPYAVGGEEGFRDAEEFNRPCVLWEDVGGYHAAASEAKPGFVLPVPRRWARLRADNRHPDHAKLPGHLGVAAGDTYHPLVGFRDPPPPKEVE